MNREQIKILQPILSAFANGETVQIEIGGYWHETEDLTLVRCPSTYRIKPKPAKRLKTSDELPPVFWVKDLGKHLFVLGVWEEKIWTNIGSLSMRKDGLEYSADRKTWHSFWTEAE